MAVGDYKAFLDAHSDLIRAAHSRELVVMTGPSVYRYAGAADWQAVAATNVPPTAQAADPIALAAAFAESGPATRAQFEQFLETEMLRTASNYSVISEWLKALKPIALVDLTHGCLHHRTFQKLPETSTQRIVPGEEPVAASGEVRIVSPLGTVEAREASRLALTQEEAQEMAAQLDLGDLCDAMVHPVVLVLGMIGQIPCAKPLPTLCLRRFARNPQAWW